MNNRTIESVSFMRRQKKDKKYILLQQYSKIFFYSFLLLSIILLSNCTSADEKQIEFEEPEVVLDKYGFAADSFLVKKITIKKTRQDDKVHAQLCEHDHKNLFPMQFLIVDQCVPSHKCEIPALTFRK